MRKREKIAYALGVTAVTVLFAVFTRPKPVAYDVVETDPVSVDSVILR